MTKINPHTFPGGIKYRGQDFQGIHSSLPAGRVFLEGVGIKPTLAVMAAGLGHRYGGLKQIDPISGTKVDGHILLEYAIYDAVQSGFGRIVILLQQPMVTDFKDRFGQRLEKGLAAKGVTIDYAIQPSLPEIDSIFSFREKMGGTGHAALCFKEFIDGPFVIINADDFYGRDSFRVINDFFNNPEYTHNENIHSLVGYRLKNVVSPHGAVARGICQVTADDFLISVTEREKIEMRDDRLVYISPDQSTTELDPMSYASMNFWGFNPSIFPILEAGFEKFLATIKSTRDPKKEFYLPSIVGEALANGNLQVKVLPTAEKWFGLTYAADRKTAEATIENLVSRGDYPKKLWG